MYSKNYIEEVNSISVLIPAYNCEKYILECIKSVFNQTYKIDKLVIVDDCSTDDTYEIINSYLQEKK